MVTSGIAKVDSGFRRGEFSIDDFSVINAVSGRANKSFVFATDDSADTGSFATVPLSDEYLSIESSAGSLS
jgi:hypothetical protein